MIKMARHKKAFLYGTVILIITVILWEIIRPEHYDLMNKNILPSPDSVVDAVIMEKWYPARNKVFNEIYITQHNSNKVGMENPVFEGSNLDSFQVYWRHSRSLEIRFNQGEIKHFKNIWYISSDPIFSYFVELRLITINNDWSLPEILRH